MYVLSDMKNKGTKRKGKERKGKEQVGVFLEYGRRLIYMVGRRPVEQQ